jgi:hypothetical protein
MTTTADPIRVIWRRAENGWMLQCSAWWVGFAGPSERQPGRFYWKISEVKGEHYCHTLEEAITACQTAALAGVDGHTYVMAGEIQNTLNRIVAQAFGGNAGPERTRNQRPESHAAQDEIEAQKTRDAYEAMDLRP